MAMLVATGLSAQSYHDGARLIPNDLNGTARYVGMGGAMGALGGDISVIGTNPAGIGIFRSNDASVSLGFSSLNTQSTFNGTKTSADKMRFSFDNAGFVMAVKQGDYTPLRYFNFAFNMRKVKNFDRKTSTAGMGNFSQTQQFAHMVNENSNQFGFLSPDILMDKEAYFYDDVPWLGAMAYEANLLPLNVGGNGYYSYFDPNRHRVSSKYDSWERGGIYAFDMNVAFNLYDRVYLGATLGVYDVDYRRTSTYSESFLPDDFEETGENDGSYALRNHYKLEGTGIDFKIGAIFRPIETSPLRVGVAISTPIYYDLSEYNMAYLGYDTYNEDANDFLTGTAYPQNTRGNDMDARTDYKVRTPWKYNFSLGYTVGKNLALGAEYEYQDYSSTHLKYDNRSYDYDMLGSSDDRFENDNAKKYMKGVSTLRLGAEYRFVPEFSARIGYNYSSAPMSNDAYRVLPLNSTRTDTEYTNLKEMNTYTLGFGYRGKSVYADMAYKYQTQKADFYAFDLTEQAATKTTFDRHQVLVTVGTRF